MDEDIEAIPLETRAAMEVDPDEVLGHFQFGKLSKPNSSSQRTSSQDEDKVSQLRFYANKCATYIEV